MSGTSPVGTFVQSNYNLQSGTAYPLAIDSNFAVSQRIITNFAPHGQATPNMTMAIDPGALFVSGKLIEVAAQTTGTFVVPNANPRIDRVVIDASNGLSSVVSGLQSASPVAPIIPSGKLPIARVLLQPSTTAITNSIITDERLAGGGGGSSGASGLASVLDYGAKGDGVTDDSFAIQTAINTIANAGGGIVYLTPTGHYYKIGSGLNIPAGVNLMGCGARNDERGKGFPGWSPSAIASCGSWILSTNLTNPAVTMQAGSIMDGVNFVYNQTPDGSNWTPIVYPYTIHMTSQAIGIRNIRIINASHGIHIDPSTNDFPQGGQQVTVDNCTLSVFNVGMLIEEAADSIRIANFNLESIFGTNQAVWMLNNLIGIDCRRCDNPWLSNCQFFSCKYGILFTNGNEGRSMINATWTGLQFNLCTVPIAVSSSSVVVSGINCSASFFQNSPLSFIDGGASPTNSSRLLDLGSNDIEFRFTGCSFLASEALLVLGSGGTSSQTSIGIPNVIFSGCTLLGNVDGTTQNLLNIAANAQVILAGSFTKVNGGGLKGGSGALFTTNFTQS